MLFISIDFKSLTQYEHQWKNNILQAPMLALYHSALHMLVPGLCTTEIFPFISVV